MQKELENTEPKKSTGKILDDGKKPDLEPSKSPEDLLNLPEPKKQRKPRMTKALKAELEKEKRKESLEFAKIALPQGLVALEELLLNRIEDKELVRKLKLTEPEKSAFTESLVMVAEKRNWFKAEDTPEIALSIAILSIVGSRIEIIKVYRDEKRKKTIPESKSDK